MRELMKKHIKVISVIMVVIVLIITLGIGYAIFNYNKTGISNKIIAGTLYLTLNEGNDSISLENVFPESKEEARAKDNNTITFTLKGKNTSPDKAINYEIILNNGDDSTNPEKERYQTKDLVFDLVEIGKNNEETMILDAVSYETLENQKIWIDKVDENTNDEIERTYQLRMWVSEDVVISDSDPNADYTTDEYKNLYANVKVAVEGDLQDKVLPLTVTTDNQFVENGQTYFNTVIKNVDNEANDDTYNLTITSSNPNIQFVYKDEPVVTNISNDNKTIKVTPLVNNSEEELEKIANEEIISDNFAQNYTIANNKKITFKISLKTKDGNQDDTDLTFSLKKNGVVVQTLVKHISVKGIERGVPHIEFVNVNTPYTGNGVTLGTVTITNSDNTPYTGTPKYTYYKGNSCSGQEIVEAPVNAGTYSVKIFVEGAGTDSDYTSCGVITIAKKEVTADISNCSNKTYDGKTNASCTITLEGKLENDEIIVNGTCNTETSEAGTNKDVTCTSLALTGASKNNYVLKSDTIQKEEAVNIAKVKLTVTADDKSMTYGDNAPTYTYKIKGFVNNENINVLSGSVDYTIKNSRGTTVTIGSTTEAGTYTIIPSGLTSTNYDIVYENGKLVISNNNILTASIGTCTNKEYDGNTNVTCSITLRGETEGVSAIGTCNTETSTVGNGKKVTCTGITLTGTNAGSYQLNNTNAEKDSAVNITAKKCDAPTNVTIGTDGKITWTASSNCSSATYQIKVASGSYANAVSGVDKKSDITSATGTRTVYVKAIAPNSNYSDSDEASKSTTVYSVSLTKGTGISAVTGAGNYITGATVTLGATASEGYTWSKWTETSGGAQVSTTNAYSVAISGNLLYTANASANTYDVNYDFDELNNFNLWNKMNIENRFTASYDSSNYVNTISGTGIGGWEQYYLSLNLTSGRQYKLSFSYVIGDLTPLSGYSGIGIQILNAIPGNNDNISNDTVVEYLTANTSGTKTITFTATNTTYLNINLGMINDNVATNGIKLGNFRIIDTGVYDSNISDIPNIMGDAITYSGWYTARTNGIKITTSTKVGTSNTFYGELTKNNITVSFNGNGGSNGTAITKTADNQIGNLPTSTRTGYTFNGWYTATGGGNEVKETWTMPSSNTTYYAHWTLNNYTISYTLNDGAVATSNPTNYNVTTDTFALNNPTRTGYTFIGWTGSNDLSSGLDGYTTSSPYVAAARDHILGDEFDVTVGATYRVIVTAKRTSGSLDMQGGIWYTEKTDGSGYEGYSGAFTFAETLSDGYARYYKDITVPTGKIKGKFFIQLEQTSGNYTTSWSIADMHVVLAPTSVSIDKGSAGNKSYTANWKIILYRVTYQGNGATQLVNSNLLAKYDAQYHNSNTLTDINGNNKDATANNVTFGTDYMQFDGSSSWVNLGIMNSNYQTMEITFSPDALKGCIIGNWEAGGGGLYIDGNKLVGEYYIEGAYRTYESNTALEVGKKYHAALTYDGTTLKVYLNGKLEISQSVSGTIGVPANSTIMALGGNPGGQTVGSPDFKGKIYNVAVYDIALSADQIASDAGKDVTYNSTYGTLPTPQRIGYIFDGWYKESNLTNLVTSSSTVSNEDHTLYAKWIEGFPVTYETNGGNFENGQSTNVINYAMSRETITKYSHTSNIDDTGKKNSNYGNSWTNANITGTDRGNTSEAHVVTIPGASSITVDIYYNGESTSYDWVTVWEGSHPTYTAASNYSSGISGATKLGGSQSGTYTVNDNSLTNMGKTSLTVNGDTVTFGFKSDGSGVGQGYGYYAVISGESLVKTVVKGTYAEPTKEGYIFAGWYLDSDNTQHLDISDTTSNITAHAKWQTEILCIRANNLHTETCSQTSNHCYADGWRANGTKGTTTITYGSLGTSGVLATGDAFNCDVNGDGTFDEENERFYYVSDFYHSNTQSFDVDYATLVYYKNYYEEEGENPAPSNKTDKYATANNYNGPIYAVKHLPSVVQWPNVSLVGEKNDDIGKQIIACSNENCAAKYTYVSSTSYSLPKYSYKVDGVSRAARLLTLNELYNGCYGSTSFSSTGALSNCNFIFENTKYSNSSNASTYIMLNTPYYSSTSNLFYVYPYSRKISSISYSNTASGIRPAIEIPKSRMVIDVYDPQLVINPNGGSVTFGGDLITTTTTKSQKGGSTINYSKPTKESTVEGRNAYTIQYDSNGGSPNPSSQISKYENLVTYPFINWTKTGSCGVLSSTTGAGTYSFPLNNDTCTLSAQFESTPVITETSTVYSVILPAAPTREDYVFKGWKSSSDGNVYQAGERYTPTENTTMTAQWKGICEETEDIPNCGNYGSCSATYQQESGTKTRSCTHMYYSTEVSGHLCSTGTQYTDSASCSGIYNACSSTYESVSCSDYSLCSVSCKNETGTKTRTCTHYYYSNSISGYLCSSETTSDSKSCSGNTNCATWHYSTSYSGAINCTDNCSSHCGGPWACTTGSTPIVQNQADGGSCWCEY